MTTRVPYQLLNPEAQAALTAFRNKLINADFRVNQRGYVSGAATGIANQYTLDRWRVVTSGQFIGYSQAGNVFTCTAPAGGMEQVIEGINLVSGTYVLDWTGTATATVGGVAVAKRGTVSVTGGNNLTIRFSGGTVSQPQFELGTVPTAFEDRPQGLERLLCQRYFETGLVPVLYLPPSSGFLTAIMLPINFKATKRTNGYVMAYGGVQIYVSGIPTPYTGGTATTNPGIDQCSLFLNTTVTNNHGTASGTWACDNEL